MEFIKHETEQEFLNMDVGAEVTGVYVGKEPSTKYPNTYNYKIDLGEDKGIKKVNGVVVAKHFEDLKNPIHVGTVVKLIYHGKPQGKNYHEYEVYVGVKK